ncbi:MAG: hypothetical protein ACK5T0_07425 [Vampirovibrionales bacterium]
MFVNNTQLSPKAQQRQGKLSVSIPELPTKIIQAKTPMKEFEKLEKYLKGIDTDAVSKNPLVSVLVERPKLNARLVKVLTPLFESIDPNYLIARRIPTIQSLLHNWTATFKLLEMGFKQHLSSDSLKHITDKKHLFPNESCATGGCMPALSSLKAELPLDKWLKILADDRYAPDKSPQMK